MDAGTTTHATKAYASVVPHYGGGDDLVDLLVHNEEEKSALMSVAVTLPSLQLSARNVCDLEMLATGAFSPLDSFMGKSDYESVLNGMRLSSGVLWPLPITLTTVETSWQSKQQIALRDLAYNVLAIMTIEEIFEWDPQREAMLAYGTTDVRHPMVTEMSTWGKLCITGQLQVLQLPRYYDFQEWRHTPRQLRAALREMDHRGPVVGFQTRNPLHRAHEEMTKRAAAAVNGVLVLHPVVGLTKPGDVDHYTRARVYIALYERYYDPKRTLLSFLPLAMRMAGPREALLHAIIRRNHGVTHFIVGRDHAGPGLDSNGKPFYEPYAAQELMRDHAAELGVIMVPFRQFVYLSREDRYAEVPEDGGDDDDRDDVLSISGTQVREQYLAKGAELPPWFTRPETAAILRHSYPPRFEQGFCVWFTGLSGAGKSTIASILQVMLLERGRHAVTLLDGDVVRTHLSKGLGFSAQDRLTNNLRIAFVASAIVTHRGSVIAASISPYKDLRQKARNMVGEDHFIEVFVDTPLAICEQRDSKGLYAKARNALAAGVPMGFTGIDDPYEEPLNPDLRVDCGAQASPDQAAQKIVTLLIERGFLRQVK